MTQDEGQYLLRLVRRGRHDCVRYRRALIIMASASGTGAAAIARLVAVHRRRDPRQHRSICQRTSGAGQ